MGVGAGEKCLPKHWDAKRQLVKNKPDADAINQVLDDHTVAAQALHRAAQGAPLGKDQLRAGIVQHVAALVTARTGQAPLPPPPKIILTLLDYFDQWIGEEEQKVSVRTERLLSPDTI